MVLISFQRLISIHIFATIVQTTMLVSRVYPFKTFFIENIADMNTMQFYSCSSESKKINQIYFIKVAYVMTSKIKSHSQDI